MNILIGILIFYVVVRLIILWELNGGVCRKCGGKLEGTVIDSQGNTGYRCENCGYTVWS